MRKRSGQAATSGSASSADDGRPAHWAEPLKRKGAPNFHRVDTHFYRSAQPSRTGFEALADDPGIRTVVNLRAFHRDDDLAQGLGLQLERIPIHTWHIRDEAVVAALRAIRSAQPLGPVLLHCQHGADRTGLITALYRVLFQGWPKPDALHEMREGRFGYHAIWGNIPAYLERADVAALHAALQSP